jgi:hypothetical protein
MALQPVPRSWDSATRLAFIAISLIQESNPVRDAAEVQRKLFTPS